MRSRSFRSIALFLPAAAAFALLIIRGDLASAAAKDGLETCLRSVIPSLFPFLVLTNLLLRLELPECLLASLGAVFERVFRIRATALPVLLAGFVGGYPLGAVAAAECCRLGACSEEEAGRLTVYANNCSPGFLFGLLGRVLPGGSRQAFLLLILQWSVSLGMGFLLGAGRRPSVRTAAGAPPPLPASAFGCVADAVKNGGRAMLTVCAYVVFFNVFSAFLPGYALLRGFIEMTGGVLLLSGEWSPEIAAFLIGWGGLSVCFQVYSAMEGSGVSAARYLPHRLLHGALMAALVFSSRFGWFLPLVLGPGLFAAAFFVKKGRKETVREL